MEGEESSLHSLKHIFDVLIERFTLKEGVGGLLELACFVVAYRSLVEAIRIDEENSGFVLSIMIFKQSYIMVRSSQSKVQIFY